MNLFLIFFIGHLFWYLNYLSNNVNQFSNFLGLETSIEFIILTLTSLFLNKRHFSNQERSSGVIFRHNHPFYARLLDFP
ncbi:hypothetical protein B1F79_00840 [Coxiella-like endosymbiont of Rhipicephalus sanguineus]|nr:hypothetical protein [Coxiella-like endosymbiont of Rhipicephalus sanguineus]